MLEDCERVKADDGYTGADPEFAKGKSSPWHPKNLLSIRNDVHVCHSTQPNEILCHAPSSFKNGIKKTTGTPCSCYFGAASNPDRRTFI